MAENDTTTDSNPIDGTDAAAGGANETVPKTRARGVRRLRGFGPKAASEAVSAAPQPVPALTEAPAEAEPEPAADVAPKRATAKSKAPASGEAEATAEPVDAPAVEQPSTESVAEPIATTPTTRPRPASFNVLFQAPPALAESESSPELPTREQLDDEVQDDAAQGDGSGRRTRRRSRSGRPAGQATSGDAEAGKTTPTEVVVKAKPQQQRELITEPQKLKGSTRLEAKRQRRRDGRDAGRRRTVVTEAEFLARREAVDRVMIVKSGADQIEIGVLEDGILAEHYVAKAQHISLIGNVYLGRVQNVLPSMEAAFVDIGRGRNAVLYSGEVDWEAASDRMAEKGTQARRIELALKSGDKVLVQVTKDPIGHKGARLTSSVSLPGRFLVYVPNGSMNGISRKLPDTERARLKRILKDALPDSAGVIVRTAAEGAAEEQLIIDVQRLTNQWAEIDRLVETANAPSLLHSEPDLLVKIVRDVFNEDFAKLIIAGDDARATIERYVGQVAPELLDRIERWEGRGDVFAAHRVTEQIEKALDHKVWLPSGGSLVIDRTEAMTVIDVNTGKFVGSGGNLEETVTKNNLEAAEEIVRQLRLRDIGGIIVIDFIDMVLETNRDLVLRRLVECLSRDRTKHQVAEVTSLGLVQMTRKRLGIGLAESMSEDSQSPDMKQEPQGRRRRGGTSASQQQQRPAMATHAITSDAKNALAQIAGATIVAPAIAPAAAAAVAPVSESTDATAGPETLGAPSAEPQAARVAPAEVAIELVEVHTAEAEADAVPETLLDLPIEVAPKAARTSKRVPDEDAAILLDSVLGALPEPKRAGEGRRSRRVSTPALTPRQVE